MTKQIKSALALAAVMIGIAFLAVFDVIPQEVAQFAPAALLVLFPQVWLRRGGACRAGC